MLGTVAAAVVGGVARKLGGGKFENGAMTSAFQYMFNAAARSRACTGRPCVDRVGDANFQEVLDVVHKDTKLGVYLSGKLGPVKLGFDIGSIRAADLHTPGNPPIEQSLDLLIFSFERTSVNGGASWSDWEFEALGFSFREDGVVRSWEFGVGAFAGFEHEFDLESLMANRRRGTGGQMRRK